MSTRITKTNLLACIAGLLILSAVAQSSEDAVRPLPQEWPEYLFTTAEHVVIARQTGEFEHSKFKEENGVEGKHEESDFVVTHCFKGTLAARRIHVSAVAYGAEALPGKYSTALMYVRQRTDGSGFYCEWFELLPDAEMVAKTVARTRGIVATFDAQRAAALDELNAFAPDAVTRAKELLTAFQNAPALLPDETASEALKHAPWSDVASAEAPVLRALLALDSNPSHQRIISAAASDRIETPLADDSAKIASWFAFHFKRFNATDDLNAFAAANPRLVARFCLDFSANIWEESSVPMPGGGRRLMVKRRADAGDPIKPNLETWQSVRLLMQAEDCSRCSLSIRAVQFERARRSQPPSSAPAQPHIGPLRADFTRELLTEWLKPSADPRLHSIAVMILAEQPVPWAREWALSGLHSAPKEQLSDLAAAAGGLRDTELALNVWQEAIARGGSEREVLEWFGYAGVFDVKLVAFAINRWADLLRTKNIDALFALRTYVGRAARKLDPKAELPVNLPESARWFAAAFPNDTKLIALPAADGDQKPNPEQEVAWLRKQAEQGRAISQYMLGSWYLVKKDYANAFQWTRKAAEQHFRPAMQALFLFYQNGWGVERSEEEAERWHTLAADSPMESNDETELMKLVRGTAAREVTLQIFRERAEQGDSFAEYFLGCAYYTGEVVKADPVEAEKWYLKAAEHNHVGAQAALGAFYKDGEDGFRKDRDAAVKWLKRAIANGDRNATLILAAWYASGGDGLEADEKEAVRLMELAADKLDSPVAQWALGTYYANGDDKTPTQPDKAALYFRKAADHGNPDAQFELGRMLLDGKSIPKDTTEGIALIQKAIAANVVGASNYLAETYIAGKLLPKDLKAAHRLYLDGMNRGDSTTLMRIQHFPLDENPTAEDAEFTANSELTGAGLATSELCIEAIDARGNPIVGATFLVMLSPDRVEKSFVHRALISGRDGRIRVKGLAPGNCFLKLECANAYFGAEHVLMSLPEIRSFQDLSKPQFEIALSPGINRYRFALNRGGSVAVKVVDEKNAPLEGVSIQLMENVEGFTPTDPEKFYYNQRYVGLTDEHGERTVDRIGEGNWRIQAGAVKSGFAATGVLHVVDGQRIEVKEPLVLRVHVGADTPKLPMDPSAPPELPKKSNEKEPQEPEEPQDRPELALPAAKRPRNPFPVMERHVVTPEGILPPGCEVLWISESGLFIHMDNRHGMGVTELLNVQDASEQPYRMIIRAPGFKEKSVDATSIPEETAGQKKFRIVLEREPSAPVHVHVTDAQHRPLPDASVVWVTPIGKAKLDDFLDWAHEEPQALTDENGDAELYLPLGLRSIGAALDGFRCAETVETDVKTDGSAHADLILQRTPEAVMLRGTVALPEGATGADTRVYLDEFAAGIHSAEVDAAGKFVFEHIPAGKVTLIAQHPGFIDGKLELKFDRAEQECALSFGQRGSVSLGLGKEFDHARIEVYPHASTPFTLETWPHSVEVLPENNGRTVLEAAPGRYDVYVIRTQPGTRNLGGQTATDLAVLSDVEFSGTNRTSGAAAAARPVDLDLKSTGGVTGRIGAKIPAEIQGLEASEAAALARFVNSHINCPEFWLQNADSAVVLLALSNVNGSPRKNEQDGEFSCVGVKPGKYTLNAVFTFKRSDGALELDPVTGVEVDVKPGETTKLGAMTYTPSGVMLKKLIAFRQRVLRGERE